MNKKILFFDIDGTLVGHTRQVSSRVMLALLQAKKNGHYVFLCTGRNKAGLKSLLSIDIDGFIASAGGYIEVKNKVIFEHYLDLKTVKKITEVFQKNNVYFNYECLECTFEDIQMTRNFALGIIPGSTNFEMERLVENIRKDNGFLPLSQYQQEAIFKICFLAHEEKHLEEPRRLLENEFNFVIHSMFSKENINGDLMFRGIDKGMGIKKVVEYLGLDMQDTIGFGDSMNDLEMIQGCHEGVVMSNGSEELKKHATTICESVEEDGVYFELLRRNIIT